MRTNLRAVVATLLIAGSLGLGACASGARSDQMVVNSTTIAPATAGQPGYKAFRVGAVAGGSETNPLWMSNVSGEQFRSALEQSLAAAGHLADNTADAAYEVTAAMTKLDRPMAGLDMSVTSSVTYKATPTAGGAPMFDQLVAATGTAKFGDSLIGVERLRLANEAAVRENISSFIKRLRTALGSQQAATN